MLKQDYVSRVVQVLSQYRYCPWSIGPLYSVTSSSSCCLEHNRRLQGAVNSEAPKIQGWARPENLYSPVKILQTIKTLKRIIETTLKILEASGLAISFKIESKQWWHNESIYRKSTVTDSILTNNKNGNGSNVSDFLI